MVFGEIISALSLWEKLGKWYKARAVPPVESVATRFVRLLGSHGVHRNQIPRFIGHGLALRDVEDDAALLAKLDEVILEDTCARFAIRREWLDGAETQVHPCHDFYKRPEAFLAFVENLKANNPDSQIGGALIFPNEKVGQAEALLILQETIGHVGDKPIFRYHLCNGWDFSYWKARAYLTACTAIAWKRGIYIHGIKISKNQIGPLAQGETLLGWKGEGIWAFGHKNWDPEDMALRPDVFLEGIDPEQDNFGIKSGLELWLELEERGFMDIGIRQNTRPLFQQALAKCAPG